MSLAAGTRLGPYEILSAIGAGGMGEVYRARDTKLGRHVALKVVPDTFASDPDRLARFTREAQVLAALNHPHIAAIYGFEDSGDTHALVLELVEGETLADRIARGAIPLDEALPIARQIADALEAAHEQGIIHRDLKPANVKVTNDGIVKVLDFGLAKLSDPNGPNVPNGANVLTMSPTITSPALMTGAGIILGTAAYMAPEQARGKEADKRADIWAFGCVLYEMLTARRAFGAEEVSDTLAMVLMKEPDWSRLSATTPPAIRTLLRRCLEKDRKRRLPDIGAARLEIDEALTAPIQVPVPGLAVERRGQRLAWGVAALAVVAALGIGVIHFVEPRPKPAGSMRFSILPPPDRTFLNDATSAPTLSPDGEELVFQVLTSAGDRPRLAVHAFDVDDTRDLQGTDGAIYPFWSPDSRFIGFFADGKLKRIDTRGGAPEVICDLPGQVAYGGAWSDDGTIMFSVNAFPLLRVPARGGTPSPVTKLDATKKELGHTRPWFLPDGRHFLYYTATVSEDPMGGGIYVGSLDDPTEKTAVGPAESKAVYADGYVLFVRQGVLLAQPFDAARRRTTGDPVVVAQNLLTNRATGAATFAVSSTGVLAYRNGTAAALTQLALVDRDGKHLGTVGERTDESALELSPDGGRVAVSVFDPLRRSRDIWMHDLNRGIRTRFTFDAGDEWSAVWSSDGGSLTFSAGRPSPLDVFRQAANGSAGEERLLGGGGNKYVSSWSSDGRFILYGTGNAGSQTGNDIWVLPTFGDRRPRPVVQTPFNERQGRFSPDGLWVAYNSNESGRDEVYVVPFPGPGGKWQVSTSGGSFPRWRRDGKEIFFLNGGNTVMAAAVNGSGKAFEVGAVRRLFQARLRTDGYLGFGTGYV